MASHGTVSLVGAGPGDPDLLTLRALRRLQAAEVVVYDPLINPAIVALAAADAQRILATSQDEINALLVEHGRAGRRVVRLTNGDPFVFGRGGLEAELLEGAGIGWEVVSGVPTTLAAPAAAGIPVTHRDWAASFGVIAVREERDVARLIDWQPLSSGVDTLVVYLAMDAIRMVVARMLEAGRSPATPAALVVRGSLPEQRVVAAPLGELARRVAEAGITPPGVLVAGPTVKLRDRLAWQERRPLWGRRVVITRAREQAAGLAEQLRDLGAIPVEYPVIAFEPAPLNSELDEAIINLARYDWVIFTSANAVRFFLERLRGLGQEITVLRDLRLGAIGPATAAELELEQLRPTFVPDAYVAEAVVAQIGDVAGQRMLLPRADIAREALPASLAERGATVDDVVAYRTVQGTPSEEVPAMLRAGQVDAISFTSSSTVHNFLAALAAAGIDDDEARRLLAPVTLVAIGPVTAATAREIGLRVAVEAERSTSSGLIEAMVAALARQPEEPSA